MSIRNLLTPGQKSYLDLDVDSVRSSRIVASADIGEGYVELEDTTEPAGNVGSGKLYKKSGDPDLYWKGDSSPEMNLSATSLKEVWLTPEDTFWNGDGTFVINNNQQTEVGFVNAATRFFAWQQPLPSDYTSNTDVTLAIYWYATPTTGNVVWNLDFLKQSVGSAVTGSGATTVPVTASVDTSTANGLVETTFVINGGALSASAGDQLSLAIRRIGGAGGDTLVGTAKLIGGKITYT